MIISRTPYRISFFGGGTDYPAWYREHGGAVLATTVDKYCYLTCRYLPPFFEHRYRVVYSFIERVATVDDIKHPSAREVLRFMKMTRGVEIHHDGDLPARSGMGSSSAFTVGLLHALHAELAGRLDQQRVSDLRGELSCFLGGCDLAPEQDGSPRLRRLLACRELVAREAHRRGLNRQLKPAQFKLLDPRGTHILVPQFMHDKADGKPVEPHLRCHAHLKLLGKNAAVDRTVDVPMQFVRGHVDEEALIDKGIAMHAMEGETDKTPEDYGATYEEHYDLSKLDEDTKALEDQGLIQQRPHGNRDGEQQWQVTKPDKDDDKMRAEGNA